MCCLSSVLAIGHAMRVVEGWVWTYLASALPSCHGLCAVALATLGASVRSRWTPDLPLAPLIQPCWFHLSLSAHRILLRDGALA